MPGLCYVNPLMGTSERTTQQRIIIQLHGDWYTGRWWVDCYIWYSDAWDPLAVPNVTAHTSTASVSSYQLYIIRCGTIIIFTL